MKAWNVLYTGYAGTIYIAEQALTESGSELINQWGMCVSCQQLNYGEHKCAPLQSINQIKINYK